MKKFMRRAGYLMSALAAVLFMAFLIWPESKPVDYVAGDDFKAQVAAFNVPELPKDWTIQKVAMTDGTTIHVGQSGDRDSAKASILMVPGYTSSIDFYGDQYDMLTARGFHVVAMDLRGQGRSSRHRADYPQKLYVKDFSVYGDDIAAVTAKLKLGSDKPLVIMGTSLGGAAVTRAAQDHDLGDARLLLLAPAYRPSTPPLSFNSAKRVIDTARFLGKGERYIFGQTDWVPDETDFSVTTDCGSYPARLHTRDAMYMRAPELRVGGMTINLIGEMLENGEIVTAPKRAAAMDMPVTMITAERDVIIDTSISEAACTDGFPDCKLIKMPDTLHCLTLENDAIITAIYDEAETLLAR